MRTDGSEIRFIVLGRLGEGMSFTEDLLIAPRPSFSRDGGVSCWVHKSFLYHMHSVTSDWLVLDGERCGSKD